MNKKKIEEIVFRQIKELNETLPQEQQFEVTHETVLFGNQSNIDSLSLVSVIVDLETLFSSEYGIDISLTDDRAMMREKSPFDNVSSLIDYIDEVIQNP